MDPVEVAIASSAYIMPALERRRATAVIAPAQQADADQVLTDARQELQGCEDKLRANPLIYMYHICTSRCFSTSMTRISALETAASTASPVAQ